MEDGVDLAFEGFKEGLEGCSYLARCVKADFGVCEGDDELLV